MRNSNIKKIAFVVVIILLFALIGNFTVQGWNWGPIDFVVAGILLFGTGLLIDFAIRKLKNPIARIIAVLAIVLAFLMIWAEIAVDGVTMALSLLF